MIKDLLNIAFPGKCVICNSGFYADNQNVVCSKCLSNIKKENIYYCKSCGSPYENCQKCLKKRKYDYIYVYTKATDELVRIISEYKLSGIKFLGKNLADIIKEDIEKVVRENNIDIVTFIPLSKKVYKKRGFNHLEFILKQIFPSFMVHEILVKKKETKLQVDLSAEERKRNLKNAFHLKENIKGKKILVFDDILTTGTTMLEAYKEIKKGKPSYIYGYVIGR